MFVCAYCEEIVTAEELAALEIDLLAVLDEGRQVFHRECSFRAVAGSVSHIRRECHYFGGALDCHACEEGLTKREAARASWRERRLRYCSPN